MMPFGRRYHLVLGGQGVSFFGKDQISRKMGDGSIYRRLEDKIIEPSPLFPSRGILALPDGRSGCDSS